MSHTTPTIGITMGDAAGIGPEIVLKALADEKLRSNGRYVIIGDLTHLEKVRRDLNLDIRLVPYSDGMDGVAIYDLKNLLTRFTLGIDAAETGRAAAENIETAVALWRRGKIGAIVTAPISKKAIALGGYDFPGHTEFLAELTGTKKFAMSILDG